MGPLVWPGFGGVYRSLDVLFCFAPPRRAHTACAPRASDVEKIASKAMKECRRCDRCSGSSTHCSLWGSSEVYSALVGGPHAAASVRIGPSHRLQWRSIRSTTSRRTRSTKLVIFIWLPHVRWADGSGCIDRTASGQGNQKDPVRAPERSDGWQLVAVIGSQIVARPCGRAV